MILRKNMFVFFILFGLLGFSGVVSAADFNITTFQNITDNCDYNSGTYTYNCSVDSNGDVWDNIYILNSLSVPINGLNGGKIDFYTNGVFNVSGSIFANGINSVDLNNYVGGSGGAINIRAKSIFVSGGLSVIGGESSGSGGIIILKAEDVIVLQDININGARGNRGMGGGAGGYLEIIADNAFLRNIYASAGAGGFNGGYSGSNGGTVKLNVTILNLNIITAIGGNGYGDSGRGGSGGLLELTSLNSVINGNLLFTGGAGYIGGVGGSILINSLIFELKGSVNLNAGSATKSRSPGGRGGNFIFTGQRINRIGSISANGGNSLCLYNGGAGGYVNINTQNNLFLSKISVNGGVGGSGCDRDGKNGGSAGKIIVDTNNYQLNVNDILQANGGVGGAGDSPYRVGGAGGNGGIAGTINLYAKNILVNAQIVANGGIGGVGKTNGANTFGQSGNGGAGGKIRIVSNLFKNSFLLSVNGGNGGGNGQYNIGGGYGGSAGKIIIYSLEIYIDAPVEAKGGAGVYGYTGFNYEYHRCGSGGSGGSINIFTDEIINLNSYSFDVSGGIHPAVSLYGEICHLHRRCNIRGCYRYRSCSDYYKGVCGTDGVVGKTGDGPRTVPTGFRLTSTIKKVNTNNLFTGSTQIRIIDPESGIHVPITKTYNAWFGETEIDNGGVNSLFGDKPLMIKLAKKYYLEVTTSDDLFFSKANCDLGLANCDTHFVEFRQYYE